MLEQIKEEIKRIAVERNFDEAKAFAFFFLEDIEDLSSEEAEFSVIDGPWDGKLDAFYHDDENRILHFYQFKYTENPNYALSGINDLVKAVRMRLSNIQNNKIQIKQGKTVKIEDVDTIKVSLVTLAKLSTINGKTKREFEKEKTRNLKSFLKSQKLSLDGAFEIFDYYKIDELYTGAFGIPEVELDIGKTGFIRFVDNTGNVELLITILKGEELANLCEEYGDELFSSNVRRFLGLRKGSVNWGIFNTLSSDEKSLFVAYNNGIVGICRDYKIHSQGKIMLERFAVVNGAQTVNVLLKAKEKSFDFSEVYVPAKIIKTKSSSIAAEIARTANSQNPTNVRDLRALDKLHQQLNNIFGKFGYTYIYKRGIGVKGKNKVKMKELAQALVAFKFGEPHTAYARVNTIFSGDYYDKIFDERRISEAMKDSQKMKELLVDYLVPYKLLLLIKEKLKDRKNRPIDPAFTYHILWVFEAVYAKLQKPCELEDVDSVVGDIFEKYFSEICKHFKLFIKYRDDIQIPRSLKSGQELNKFVKVREEIIKPS